MPFAALYIFCANNCINHVTYLQTIYHKIYIELNGCRTNSCLNALFMRCAQKQIKAFNKFQLWPKLLLVLFFFFQAYAVLFVFGINPRKNAFEQFMVLAVTFFFCTF